MAHYECQNCGANLEVTSTDKAVVCTFCRDPSIIERPQSANRPNPLFAVGFVIPEKAAAAIAHQKINQAWLAPGAFRRAKAEKITGVYIPSYLYSVRSEAEYWATIGENYTEQQVYTTIVNGKRVTRTRTVIRTEWYPLTGRHTAYLERVVTASAGIPNRELEAIEPFDLRALARYRPETLAGFAAEDASLEKEACLATAKEEAHAEVGSRIRQFLPGDSQRDVDFRIRFNEEDLSLALVPVWVLAVRYREDRPAVRVLVNGQTGKAYLDAPTDPIKVTLLVVVGLLAVFLFLWLAGAFQ